MLKRLLSLVTSLCLAASMGLSALAQDELPEAESGQPEVVAEENTSDPNEGIVTYGTPDADPPELLSFAIDRTTVEAGGTITATITATDSISGVSHISAGFRNSENGRGYSKLFISSDLENGICTWTIEISPDEPEGTFYLESVSLTDNNKNSQTYYSKDYKYLNESSLLLPEECSFTVNSFSSNDTFPVLTNFSINKTEVEAPGTITAMVAVTDDISSIRFINAQFCNLENDRRYSIYLYPGDLVGGVYTKTIEISQYELDGTFQLEYVSLYDNNNNPQTFYSKDYKHLNESSLLLPQEVSFVVISSMPDSTPPVLENFFISKTSVVAPATITVTASATDDLSGVSRIEFVFCNPENGRRYSELSMNLEGSEKGFYTDTIEISQYELDGTFQLEHINVIDNNRNSQYYYSKGYDGYKFENSLLLPQEVSFTVSNKPGEGDVVTNTNHPDLADAIENMADGKTAAISYESNPQISANVFEAIEGTDKKLVLEGNGIQWEFNGKDINSENIKPLDLHVDISPLSTTPSENVDEIKDIVDNTPTMVLHFPNNGQLPGMAKIRIKADYTFRNMVGTKQLNVYYYDNTEKKLKLISSNVDLTGDGWLEFYTNHNSDFIVTAGAPNTAGPDRPNISETGAASSGSSSSNDSDENAEFWRDVAKNIRNAKNGDTIRIDAGDNDSVSSSVFKAMRQNPGVSLEIKWGRKTITIPAGQAPNEAGRLVYPLSYLASLDFSTNIATSETSPNAPVAVVANPSTGAA